MDWTVYWFEILACFVFASVAMFSGITGAGLMFPWFLAGFALLGVPELSVQQAIVASLFLESSAFGIGIARYAHRGLIDTATVRRLAPWVLPAGVAGALLAQWSPDQPLRLAYSALMLLAAALMVRSSFEATDDIGHQPCDDGEPRDLHASDGRYGYCAHGLRLQRGISAGGGVMTGLISTGVGEVTSPLLITRSRFPVPVAAATSIVLVAVANLAAAATHLVGFAIGDGLGEIPWNLIVWGVPGMASGAFLGVHLQGRVSERVSKRFFAVVFVAISLAFGAFSLAGG